MDTVQDFLFEMGCEELPASSQQPLVQAMATAFEKMIKDADIPFKKIELFATPRRLSFLVQGLATQQPSKVINRQGPALSSAFSKDGSPTPACTGFAKSCGVSVDQLAIVDTEKGQRVACTIEQPGVAIIDLLPGIMQKIISKLPIPKPMRWGNGESSFIRPIEWIVMLLGEQLIDTEILGIKTQRETYGHRFHHSAPLMVESPKNYKELLETKAFVIPDFLQRKLKIKHEIEAVFSNSDNQPVIDEHLLDEVAALVEWPVVLKGTFDPSFLKVPKEALMTAMQSHQKCFPVVNNNGDLQNEFILVSNIASKDPAAVIAGNERVIRARLSDAAFFYEQDIKISLNKKSKRLDQIIFQKSLGSLGEKTERLAELSKYIADQLNVDAKTAVAGARLSKADLVTDMVGEFPNLQGVMGYYYALNDKEPESVAIAIKEHYMPATTTAKLPETMPGVCVAIADRLDTLVGILGIGKAPTGDKDPYALRRAAVGLFRLLIEKGCELDLVDLLKKTKDLYGSKLSEQNVITIAFEFIIARMRAWYIDQGVSSAVFASVIACNPKSPFDFNRRIKAVLQFQQLEAASSLAEANKRVNNLLKKQKASDIPNKVNERLFSLDAEKVLSDALNLQETKLAPLFNTADYTQVLTELSTLKTPIDTFFSDVMIMVDDDEIRLNRLALLASIRHLFTQVADISLLSPLE